MKSIFTKFTEFIAENYKYILIIFIAYAIFLRLYKLWDQSFWIDEGFSSYSTLEWVNPRYFLHNISQFLSFELLWISDASARFPSVIFSLFTIPLIFLISEKLFQDKRVSTIATLIFCFSYIEITWARQARFYTLLQFLFYLNVYLSILLSQKFSIKLLSLSIWVLYISLLFHPFLYTSLIIFLWVLSWELIRNIYWKSFFFPSIKSILPIVIVFSTITIHQVYKLFQWEPVLGVSNVGQKLPDSSLQNYIDFYSGHLLWETWWLYILFIISFFIFAIQRKTIKTIIFTVWFLFAFYIISQKGILFHTRYVFFLFPLIFIWGTYAYFYLWDYIKNVYAKTFYYIFIWALIVFSLNLNFTPQSHYSLDFTAPQVDFKSAYSEIPAGSDIISGFPVMCEWYYETKESCIFSLAINFVGTPESWEKILKQWEELYTWLPYLTSLSELQESQEYYFVLDNLSQERFLSQELHREILEKWEIYYNSGTEYKNIQIIRLKF